VVVAGTVICSSAVAQRAPHARHAATRPTPVRAPLAGRINPDLIRAVQVVNGQIVPLSGWLPYTGGTDTNVQYVFDNVQDAPGITPGTLPSGGRYYFEWTANAHDYTSTIRTFDMAGIPAAAWGQGATVCDVMFYENVALTPLYITVITAETFNANAAPTDPSWGTFPGIQAAFTAGAGIGFWFSSIDVTGQPPPVGDGWRMPTDGAGAYIYRFSRDAAGTTPAQGVQSGAWGTGNYAQPPVARVGTQGLIGHSDDSTPPNCAANLASNIGNLVVELTCETYNWDYSQPPGTITPPDPTTLAPAIGFGMKVQSTGACCVPSAPCQVTTATACAALNGVYQGDNTTCSACGPTCYPNCDSSTVAPCVNIQDFGCFLNSFLAGCSGC
jgi:hypothetical protein